MRGHAENAPVSAEPGRTHYTGRMEFEWDPSKAARNFRKHKVTFKEATTVFGDIHATTAYDPDHSAGEYRYITVILPLGCRTGAAC